MPEFLNMNLESTILVKLKKDIVLDDGNFLYNMKSDHWIHENSLDKVDKNLPFKSIKFEHEEYFLVKFDHGENIHKIDTIEDNNHVKMSNERMEKNISDEQFEKREEIAITDKIKNKMDTFINQVNETLGNNFNKEDEGNDQNFFPVTKKGFSLNMSIRMNKNFDYSAFKIDPGFHFDLDLSPKSYEKFKYSYDLNSEAIKINFYDEPINGNKLKLINNHKNGNSLILLNNQPNILYLEGIFKKSINLFMVCMLIFKIKI